MSQIYSHLGESESLEISGSTFCDSCSQGGLAVINVTDCSNVHMRLFSRVGLLGLCSKGPPTQRHSTLQEKNKKTKPGFIQASDKIIGSQCNMQFVFTLTSL